MSLNIPMPGQPIDSLLKGINTGSEMFSRMMNPIVEREKIQQQKELLPYLIQGYQDTHKTAADAAQQRDLFHGLIRNALLKSAGQTSSTESGGSDEKPWSAMNDTTNAPPETPVTGKLKDLPEDPVTKEQEILTLGKFGVPRDKVDEHLKNGGSIASAAEKMGINWNGQMVSPEEARASLAKNSNMASIGAVSQIQGIPNGQSGLPQQGMQGAQSQPQAQQQSKPMLPPNMSPGQEITISAGNPAMSWMDSVAGIPTSGVKAPKTEIKNGFIQTTYPSGKVTAKLAPHLPGEKSESLHGPARDASDLEKLKKEAGENSEVYQNAKAAYDAQVDAKKDLRDLRARTKAGIKPGEKEFFDPKSGVPLGKEVPFTAAERQSEEGNILFNKLYPIVYKGASPFSGEGSITRLNNAAANYKTDPKARKLFDDFLLANKMMAATAVNEASTLKARGTNNTYHMIQESLNAQDIPRTISKLITQYKLPASAQLKAAMRYQKALSDARKEAHANVPANKRLYYDPEKQAQHEQEDYSGEPTGNTAESSGNTNEVIVIDPNGKRFKTTPENAAHLPEGWKHG